MKKFIISVLITAFSMTQIAYAANNTSQPIDNEKQPQAAKKGKFKNKIAKLFKKDKKAKKKAKQHEKS